MYNSDLKTIITKNPKRYQNEVVDRLHRLGFNIIPMNKKKPCIKWKKYQTERVTVCQITKWRRNWFIDKNGQP